MRRYPVFCGKGALLMKQILIPVYSAFLLCACAPSAQPSEPVASPETTPVPTELPETAEIESTGCRHDREPLVIHFPMRTDTQDVIFELDDHYVTFQIPADCRYELTCDENTEILHISKNTQEIVSLYHGFLGVCGTGLEEKEDTLAGHPVHYGYYDGNTEWTFIGFDDLKFSIAKSGPAGHEDIIDLMLDTMYIGDYPASQGS